MAKDDTKITSPSSTSSSPNEVNKMLKKIEAEMKKREDLHQKLPPGVRLK